VKTTPRRTEKEMDESIRELVRYYKLSMAQRLFFSFRGFRNLFPLTEILKQGFGLENSSRKVYVCNRSFYYWGEREKRAGKKGKEKKLFSIHSLPTTIFYANM